MAEFNVEFVASAAKEFRSLPADLKHRVGLTIDSLGDDPFPAGVRKLHGHKRLYRGPQAHVGSIPTSGTKPPLHVLLSLYNFPLLVILAVSIPRESRKASLIERLRKAGF